jgi:tripartite-type tricarboxylate transporter receptor subunit TctC
MLDNLHMTPAPELSLQPPGLWHCILRSLAALLSAGTFVYAPPSAAQSYPSKPIRLVVPYPPGGANDNLARPLVQKLSENMGTQVILDNRGGGGAMIGADLAAKAPADGYTLLFCSTATHATSPQLFRHAPYDPFKDFEPIILLVTSPVLAAVNNHLAIGSIKGLVAAAKANPGKLTYGSGGVGSVSHLSVEIFKSMADIDLLHVPYKGGGDFQVDMIAGRIDLQFNSAPTVVPYVKAGRMKALALARASRWPDLADVPTFAESGWPQYQPNGWYGLCAPARTPRAIIDRLNLESVKAVTSAFYRDRLAMLVADPVGSSPQEFAAYIRSEYEKYGKVIKATGARVE